jgi:drug/metabolite transporter (DMT)-like permease
MLGASSLGLVTLFVRWAMADGVGTVAAAFWRLLLAAPVLWALTLTERRRPNSSAGPSTISQSPARARGRRADILWLTVPGLFFACDLTLWHWSIRLTSVANAALFTNLAVIVVSLVGWIWLRERFGATFVAGGILALIGAAVLLGVSFTISGERLLGDALGLTSALFYGSYQLSVKRLRDRFTAAQILSTSALSSAAALLLISLVTRERLLPASWVGWAAVVAMALVSHVGGQGLIAHAVVHLPVSLSSVALLMQPLVSAVTGWAFLGETMGLIQLIGGAVVLAGIGLARYGSLRAGDVTARGEATT